jgi:glutaminase
LHFPNPHPLLVPHRLYISYHITTPNCTYTYTYTYIYTHEGIGFENGVFLSEKQHADRNVSLAYYMRENNAFDGYPTASELHEHLDLYFHSCSIAGKYKYKY